MKKDGQCDLWGIMYLLVAFFKRKKHTGKGGGRRRHKWEGQLNGQS